MDAIIIEGPTSTKNADKQRDSGEKGNEWHFGERLHIGVDEGTGYDHSLEATAANTGERDVVPLLIRSDDGVLYGDVV